MIDIIVVSHLSRDQLVYGYRVPAVRGREGGHITITEEVMDTTPEPNQLIITCQEGKSAAVNRNYGLALANNDVTVMLDDDITGFYPGWLTQLVDPLSDDGIALVSARLINPDGTEGPMMGGNVPFDDKLRDASRSGYKNYPRVPTAAIAFRKTHLRFNEGFIGSGYEDTDWMNRFNEVHQGKRIVIQNTCRLVHLNEEKNQGGKFWQHNHDYYMSLYPDDDSARYQRDWTTRNR